MSPASQGWTLHHQAISKPRGSASPASPLSQLDVFPLRFGSFSVPTLAEERAETYSWVTGIRSPLGELGESVDLHPVGSRSDPGPCSYLSLMKLGSRLAWRLHLLHGGVFQAQRSATTSRQPSPPPALGCPFSCPGAPDSPPSFTVPLVTVCSFLQLRVPCQQLGICSLQAPPVSLGLGPE